MLDPTIQLLATGIAIINGARWIEVHHEINQETTCQECTVWSPGEAGAPFFSACPYATGGNGPGHLAVEFTQCGRTAIIAHDGLSALWSVVGYHMDSDGDAVVGSADFFSYLSAFFASDPAADFTGDGQVTSQDVVEYIQCFLSQQ